MHLMTLAHFGIIEGVLAVVFVVALLSLKESHPASTEADIEAGVAGCSFLLAAALLIVFLVASW